MLHQFTGVTHYTSKLAAAHRELTPRHRIPCAQKTSKPILAGLRCSVRLGFAPLPNCRAFDVRSYVIFSSPSKSLEPVDPWCSARLSLPGAPPLRTEASSDGCDWTTRQTHSRSERRAWLVHKGLRRLCDAPSLLAAQLAQCVTTTSPTLAACKLVCAGPAGRCEVMGSLPIARTLVSVPSTCRVFVCERLIERC